MIFIKVIVVDKIDKKLASPGIGPGIGH